MSAPGGVSAGGQKSGLRTIVARLATEALNNRALSVALALVAAMYTLATFFNHIPGYMFIFRALAVVALPCAFLDPRAAVILLACVPLLDLYAVGFQIFLPLVSVAGAVVRSRRHPARGIPVSLLDVGVATFALAAVLSVPFAVDRMVSLSATVRILALAAAYFFVSRAMREPATSRLTAYAFAAAGTWSALVAIGQSSVPHFLVPLIGRYTWDAPGPVRAIGFSASPNTLGVTLMLSALICLQQALESASTRRMLGWGLLTFISAFGIALTLSRGAFVGAAVGSLVLIYMRGISRKASVPVMVTIAALLVAALATGAVTRAASVLDFKSDPSSMDRIYLSEVSVKMFAEHPAFGVGIAGFQAEYPRFRDPRVVVEPVLEGHQMIFSIPAELGILGLISEILIGGSLLYAVFGLRRREDIEGVAVVGLVASVAYGAIAFFNTLQFMAPFWLALAWADSLMVESGFLTRVVGEARAPIAEIER